ncbi:MAG: transglycosylase SLT domain-containing protein [Anaerolineae bacterium]
MVGGCGPRPTPPPVVVTATPHIPPSTPTPTLPPTVPPTPIPPPDVELHIAEQHLRNGTYENAIEAFQTVLSIPAGGVPVEVRSAAAYGLAEAALRDGRFDAAVSALTLFLTQFPDDVRVPWAYFLRGEALLGLGQWQAAIADFEQYRALRPGIIDSYVLERIGDAYLALGAVPEATQAYEQGIEAGRSLVPLLALRERVAQVYLNTGQAAQAVAQYDAILDVARNAGYRAEILYLAGQALELGSDLTGALARYRELIEAYPETGYAYRALQRLLEAGETVDAALRGQISFAAEDYAGAIEALHQHTTQVPLSQIPPDLHLMLGRAYRAVGNMNAAWTSFQTVVDLHPTSGEFGVALLEQGRTRFLAGDIEGAIERYRFLADTYPQLPQAAEALWRVGYLLEQEGSITDAVATYERLGRGYPGDSWAMDGLLRAATIALNQNDQATAERVLAALGATGTGDDAAAAYLWLGRLAQQNGNLTQAESAYRAAAAADPEGFFSLRAEDLLVGRAPFQPPAAYRFEFEDQLELGQAEDWLRATFGITQPEALWPMSDSLAADPRVIAGRELWAVLAVDEARREFDGLLEAYKDDPLASYQLAIWLRGLGAYAESIVGAANVIKAANIPTRQAPAYLARMRYPAFYRDVVIAEAQKYGLDPLLLFALIRQESLFDRYATAAAGEKGLTQVIPSTGEHIASRLQWPDYQHTDLFKPYASIAFGAYYLWEQLNLFDFNVPVGLAAYNAGPGNAASWLAASGSDPDRFIEGIGFESTQAYVRRIYEHHAIYRHLYGVS